MRPTILHVNVPSDWDIDEIDEAERAAQEWIDNQAASDAADAAEEKGED